MTAKRCEPREGNWYKNEDGVSFEVLTVDREEQLVEIQYFDGSVEALDFGSWYESRFTHRQPPMDCSGSFADLAWDGPGEAPHPTVWSGPLDGVDLESEWSD